MTHNTVLMRVFIVLSIFIKTNVTFFVSLGTSNYNQERQTVDCQIDSAGRHYCLIEHPPEILHRFGDEFFSPAQVVQSDAE